MLVFELLGSVGKRVAEIVERDAVEDEAQRIGLVAQRRRRRREHAAAELALPELGDLELLAAGALADEAGAAAMRAALGRFDGMRNAVSGERGAAILSGWLRFTTRFGTSRILVVAQFEFFGARGG